jgi:hypothetical protein
MDEFKVPTTEQVRELLLRLTWSDLETLSRESGVSKHTMYKIQRGEVGVVGLDTVHRFLPFVVPLAQRSEAKRLELTRQRLARLQAGKSAAGVPSAKAIDPALAQTRA